MKCVLEWLERTAEKYPQKIAVEEPQSRCTYAELLERSRRIGSALAAKIDANTPVAVYMEKGIDTVCAFFGIVYAGGFYSQLNPELPPQRLLQIEEVLRAPYILTDRESRPTAAAIFPEALLLCVEELKTAEIDGALLAGARETMLDVDPLYANFTSGSTGVPKGVVVSHRSVLDFIGSFTELFSIGENDRIGNQAPFDFDVSVKDIYSAVAVGATLVIIPRSLFSRPAELLDYLCEKRVTTLVWAVSALCLISTVHGLDYKTPETVNKVLFSGEVMPLRHLRSWMEHLPKAEFVNLYGPTEITCNCTYHRIDRSRDYEAGIPVGRAFPNKQIVLLDDQDRRVTEVGKTGEICVRGSGVALGYYCAKEQTERAFVQNPLNERFRDILYRTGDLGRFDENGELFFCGRKDFQIKYMGHRIELEEIEKRMSEVPGIERCCCVFDAEKSRLYGFYLGTLDKKELFGTLKTMLPVYMIPGVLKPVESMPMTKNGKIDRKELLRLAKERKGEKNGTT